MRSFEMVAVVVVVECACHLSSTLGLRSPYGPCTKGPIFEIWRITVIRGVEREIKLRSRFRHIFTLFAYLLSPGNLRKNTG